MENSLNNKICFVLLTILPVTIILGVAISLITIVLISLSFLFFSFKNREFSWIKDPYFKLLSILFVYLLFNSIMSVDPANSLPRNLGFIRYILFVFAIKFFIKHNKNYKIIFLIWILIVLTVCVDVYYESYHGENLLGYQPSPGSRRIVSFFKDEYVVGGFLATFLFIICGFLFTKKLIHTKWKTLNYIVPFAVLIAIILTTERSNTIKSLIGILIIMFIFKEILLKEKIIFLSVFAISIISLIYFSENLQYRLYGQFAVQNKEYHEEQTIKQNLISYMQQNLYFKHYRAGYEVFKTRPAFGVGNKNFGITCFNEVWIHEPKKFEARHDTQFSLRIIGAVCSSHPHQIYIGLLAEHGIIGTLIILSVIFRILWLNMKNYLIFKNPIHFGSMLFVILTFLPLLPTGSFFANFYSTLIWINFAIMLAFEKENHIKNN